jgi:hypothetical protein
LPDLTHQIIISPKSSKRSSDRYRSPQKRVQTQNLIADETKNIIKETEILLEKTINVDLLYSISNESRNHQNLKKVSSSQVRVNKNRSHLIDIVGSTSAFRDDGCPNLKSPVNAQEKDLVIKNTSFMKKKSCTEKKQQLDIN